MSEVEKLFKDNNKNRCDYINKNGKIRNSKINIKYGNSMIPCKDYYNYYFNKLLWQDILEEHKLFLDNIKINDEMELFNNINYNNDNYNIYFINF